MDTLTAPTSPPGVGGLPIRPITILVAALGGEGGGVLADWLVTAATAQGFPVQSTSIPGVAQRTGATTYYLEIFPARWDALNGRAPVLALTPGPGNVDVMVASELLEAGRAMQNGYISPDRTALIASTHRVYAIAEKSAMADGRFDRDKLMSAARKLARQSILFDMAALADEAGTVINAVLFGAMVGAGALPLSRQACEAAIVRAGKGSEASLRGFDAGYRHARGEAVVHLANDDGRGRATPSSRVRAEFPPETHRILDEGVARLADYQDESYAEAYLDRLKPVLAADRDGGGGPGGYRLTSETSRYLALWMSYEDIIRVAALKTRPERFQRLRAELRASSSEPVTITEFFKPGIEEIAAILPLSLSGALRSWDQRRRTPFHIGLHIKTSTITGYLILRTLARLKPCRRRSARFSEEQTAIDRWLARIRAAAVTDLALAVEIAACANLIKGYGDTHRRGSANFNAIMAALIDGPKVNRTADLATAVWQARQAALTDPDGKSLTPLLSRS